MRPEQQVPRNALVWIIITMFTLVAPHVGRIPLWILGLYAIAVFWRIMVYSGRWSFPGRWVKVALTLTCFSGTFFSFGTLIGLEPTVALLLAAFALKLIELVNRKDGYVLLFLGYFLCITEFLFSQDIPIALYSLLNVTLITTGLVALNQPGQHRFNFKTIRLPALMLLQAFPLMLVLFFLFPRIGPLWTVPLKSLTAKTGVSDFMKPGDISNLSQSDEVAFRVQFEGEIPSREDMYWRGLVFSRLVEGAWTSLVYYEIPVRERREKPVTTDGEPVEYSVIMEPTQQNWLFSLRYARPLGRGVMRAPDYRLFLPIEMEDEYQYRVRSWPDTVLDRELSDWRRRTELALPEDTNPRTRQLGVELRRSAADDRAFVDTVLRKFNQEPYIYTLQPPTLGEDAMDEFLFETRRGFCEHYAYAFVVMMRAAGLPARVVAGYQGGEINPVNRTVIVHQFDAHAWAEVWLEGEGWVRVDPTAAVSPDRIEWGLEQAVSGEGTFLAGSPLSPLRFRSVAWVNTLRLRYDALTYQWQKWVIGYEGERQYNFLQKLLGEVSGWNFVVVLLGSWLLVLLPVALSLLSKRTIRRLSPAEKQFVSFCNKLAKAGISRAPSEAPGDYSRRVVRLHPSMAPQVTQISALYNELAYADAGLSAARRADLLEQFARAVRGLKMPSKHQGASE
ncbi:MAG: DUF3488 domain-containing protein [Halieaceae bacterium]|jgi:protein-glutamine gamma-glutamyltransferase|nr:DUF3488 domain-containing protein [Halieaceae bacterium]